MKIAIDIKNKQWIELLYIASRRKEGAVEAYGSTVKGDLNEDREIIKEEVQRAIEWHIMENTPQGGGWHYIYEERTKLQEGGYYENYKII